MRVINPAKPTKDELIRLLVMDFRKMCPTATYGEILELRMRLDNFDYTQLELLVTQVNKETL